MKPEKIVLASGNKKKLKELSQILGDFSVTLVPQTALGVSDAVEDGLTFVENAIKKARNACQQTGLPSIADDSGIEVDFLKGQPGIFSARFAGEKASDQENLDLLLEKLENVPHAERTARYQCVIVYMRHANDPTPIICQAHWEGIILDSEIGEGGFGYDPVFFCEKANMSAAQMTPDEKSAVSHRGLALEQFKNSFSELYSN